MTKRYSLILFCACTSLLSAAGSLDVYAIDVEGGKSTLFVSPSGQSMLVDTGYDGNRNRDADRIMAAAMAAGVKQIDYPGVGRGWVAPEVEQRSRAAYQEVADVTAI